MSLKIALVSSLSLLSVAACDSQVDGEHQGTVLATLTGSVRTAQPVATASAEVAVVWVVESGGYSLIGADTVEVEGSFPAQFQLSIFTPPSDDMLIDWEGMKFGVAYIVAGPAGNPDHTVTDSWLGAELGRVLVYLPETPPLGSAVAGFLRGTPAPGFHLYDVHRLTEAERQDRFDCISDLFNADNSHMPTREEMYAACGGTGRDELSMAASDLATPLDIELVDRVDFNDLPQW
ncbi:MAG: hypothetical protein H0T89_27600 [Deltaproteobacteria bacterium]|nr:hypothetical protein [Deltaproteobacteria bacterium]